MIHHIHSSDSEIRKQIRIKNIQFGGNQRLKIYGLLHCSSGKRMNRKNRVFFSSEKEAFRLGFRPCAHCIKEKYKKWKDQLKDK